MKHRILTLIASLFAIVSLSSCETDNSSMSWIYNTGWKASLDGYVLNGETINGQIRIIIRRNNYDITGQYGSGSQNQFSIKSEVLPEFDYPRILFTSESATITGIISDDHKSIHFDRLLVPGGESGDIEFNNLDFVKMGLFDK